MPTLPQAPAQGRLLIELAALQRGQAPSGAYLEHIIFGNDDTADIQVRTATARHRAVVPLTADRADCYAALDADTDLATPVLGGFNGVPADETAPARDQFAELLYDLGAQADGLTYRGRVLRYAALGYDGATQAWVDVSDAGDPARTFRSVVDFAHTSGPAVGVPFTIAEWIADGRGVPSSQDGAREFTVLNGRPSA
ncbi:hypothetical protein [Parafrankia discariae]|uniref:hypothetical protein n=1 Tax=Parafrankia discariae TaxID=365528 RepID=UPI0003705755|nr:hypothetical protein [Parafrankia discariae]